MEELKIRLDVAGDTLEIAYRDGAAISHYDLIALQLRKILELIAFASLSAHSEPYIAAYADYAKHWNARRLLRNLAAINPDFYPKPLTALKDESGSIRFDYVPSGYLTKDDFVELYQQTSAVLHVPNPFATPSEHVLGRPYREWIDLIINLLRLHAIKLPTAGDYWIVMLASQEDGKAHALTAVELSGER
jgi:hypothetical protein